MFSFRRDLDAMNRTSSSLADRLASSCFHHHVFILEFGRTLTTLEATLERYLMRSLSSWQLSYAALKKQVRVSMVKWPWEPENLATHRSGCSHTNIMSWCRIRLILTDIVRCCSSVTLTVWEPGTILCHDVADVDMLLTSIGPWRLNWPNINRRQHISSLSHW